MTVAGEDGPGERGERFVAGPQGRRAPTVREHP